MDPIKCFMDTEGDDMIAELSGLGFGAEQARRFLPEALATLMQGQKVANLFGSTGTDRLTRLLDSVDIAALASNTGIDRKSAESGLTSLLPRLMDFLEHKQGLSDLLGNSTGSLTSVFKDQ